MQAEYGPDRLIGWENHCSTQDPFRINETTARESWYAVAGYPTVFIDGIDRAEGAYTNCAQMVTWYTQMIDARLQATGGVSPVEITPTMTFGSGTVTITAHFKLVDPATLTNLRATLLLYEDNVYWCCGYGGEDTWQGVTRKIYDQNITLTNVGDDVLVTTTIPIAAGWDPLQLHGVAYLQKTNTKEIIQGALVQDFKVNFTSHVDSAPNGNATVAFQGTMQNMQTTSQSFTVEVGSPFGDWPTEYLVCGDPAWHTTPLQVTLDPGETCDVAFRATTNAVKEIRTGEFHVTSLANGRLESESFRIFNGSPAILFVDNDGTTNPYAAPLVNALNANGYLFDNWDAYAVGATPAQSDMKGFDIVIWHTAGRVSPDCLNDTDAAKIAAFMDAGGSFFLTSNYYLDALGGGTDPFTQNYLGVASYTLTKAYTQMNGVAGDPIGDGMTLPLHFQYPSWARGDDAVPGPTATTDFLAPDGSHAMIRNTMPSGAKAVFMPERFDAVSETDTDPNNTKTLIHRIVEWVKPLTVDVDDEIASRLTSAIGQVRPNPFHDGTDISFTLSAAAAGGPVQLEIFDLGGRAVAKVVDGVFEPGTYVRGWNGRTADGSVARSGVYFARLTTREGIRNAKMILLK